MLNISGILLFCVGLSAVLSVRVKKSAYESSEQIEPYIDNYSAAPEPDLGSVTIPKISPEAWMKNEVELVDSATSRYVGSATIKDAASFLEGEFRRLGLDILIDEFDCGLSPSGRCKNIIGRRVGSVSDSVLVGAHYDSLPTEGEAPGADDNASGVATLLAVAQALASRNLKRNLIFAAFSGEEQGMQGSSHFMESIGPTFNIKAAVILDQDGNPGKSGGVILESVGDSKDKLRVIDTLAHSVDHGIASINVNHHGFGSDHVPLSEGGIPAVLVIERDNMLFSKKYGHTVKDTIDKIDSQYGSAIARTVENAVVRLAMG